jgi:hypothetical protein
MYDSKTHLFLELVLAEFWPAKYWFAISTNQVTDRDQHVLPKRRNFSGFFLRIEEQRDLPLASLEVQSEAFDGCVNPRDRTSRKYFSDAVTPDGGPPNK